MNTATFSPIPVLDFRSMLSLEADDVLHGYRLYLGTICQVNLETIESAYLEADAAGLHPGTLVQFVDTSRHVGVVTGRNLSVMSNFYSPSRYPVCIHSSRGLYEYTATDAQPVPLGGRVEALLHDADFLEGNLEQAGLDDEGQAFVVISGRRLLMREIAVLEVCASRLQ